MYVLNDFATQTEFYQEHVFFVVMNGATDRRQTLNSGSSQSARGKSSIARKPEVHPEFVYVVKYF